MKLFILSVLSIIFLASCSSAPIQNFEDVSVDSSISTQKIEKAIKIAANKLGWTVKSMANQNFRLNLNLRTHNLTVDVPYKKGSYSIIYVESQGLNYDKSKNSIHKGAIRWMRNLRKAIDHSLLAQ